MIIFFGDYFSYYSIAFLYKSFEAVKVVKFISWMWLNTTSHSVKRLYTDNGREYVTSELQSFLREQEVIYKTSTLYVYQQNGHAKQLNHILLEKV